VRISNAVLGSDKRLHTHDTDDILKVMSSKIKITDSFPADFRPDVEILLYRAYTMKNMQYKSYLMAKSPKSL